MTVQLTHTSSHPRFTNHITVSVSLHLTCRVHSVID
jgi:hypothetical protein